MLNPAPFLKPQYSDVNGVPLAGGLLWTYAAGTTTPLATYTDATGDTANANPVVLDAGGFADVWLTDDSYKFILQDSDGNEQWSEDNIQGSASGDGTGGTATGWTEYAITDGQSAQPLTPETLNMAVNSSVVYDYEIIRGTTTFANGEFCIQDINGTGVLFMGSWMGGEDHGVTFTIMQSVLVCQLEVSCSSGPGSGTIKLSKRLVPA